MERVLVPAQLPRLLRAVHAALVEHQGEVDALNVFPVPDGDTGTNLAATSAAVVDAMQTGTVDGGGELTRAALRSARGNSGVIFSQIVRAVVEAVEDETSAGDVHVLARAMQRADDLARDAVADPVEGTILTAIRAAARIATQAHEAGRADLGEVLEDVRVAVSEAVAETREQLDVLRDAGVVDAGARGFEVVVVAIQAVVTGRDVQPSTLANLVPRCVPGQEVVLDANPIEVQFVLSGDDAHAGLLRSQLTAIGDSVVVVAANGLVQAHVHTDDPDAALAIGRAVGEIDEVRVTDLRPQVGDEDPDDAPTLAVVAVLPAGGLADLGTASGAAVVVGAAGSLPSVDDILRAARATGAPVVAVLPGHRNAVPTARQAAELSRGEGGPDLAIVEQAVHPLVVLSCLAVGSEDPSALADVCDGASAGEVVAAVRDADLDIGAVRAGQPLVAVDGRVVSCHDTLEDALRALLSHLGASSSEVVTIAVGADCGLGAGEVMVAALDEVGEAEVDVIDGGQRPALLLVAVES